MTKTPALFHKCQLSRIPCMLLLMSLLAISSCTTTSIQTEGVTVRYGQFFQHKQLTYNTKPDGSVVLTYSTQPKGQDELIQAVIAAYQAGQIAGGM